MKYAALLLSVLGIACTPPPQAVPPTPPTVGPGQPEPATWGPPGGAEAPAPDDPGRGMPGPDPHKQGHGPGTPPNQPAGVQPEPETRPRGRPAPRPESRPEARPESAANSELSPLERGIVDEINQLRRDPKAFARALQKYRSYYEGPFLKLPGREVAIRTFEGVAAVDQAIAVARKSEPRKPLALSPGLSRAARAHAEEIGAAGSIDHSGADGSGPYERMQRHGRVGGMSGENIGTGHEQADIMVIDLFVDDGVPSRGHRNNLLERRYGVVGVGCAPHRSYGMVCVMDFAERFEDR